MTKYIALLRGINVSGQKKIIMADLKALCETLGFDNVVTYIQSGNVIFDHSATDPAELKENLEKAIEQKYAFTVHVDVRSADEFTEILNNLPFSDYDLEKDGSKILVTFLGGGTEAVSEQELLAYVVPPEQLIMGKKAFYLHCPNGYGKTKLSNVLIERKLKVSATTRNLKTVVKLSKLTGELTNE